jgi:putative endonuclease
MNAKNTKAKGALAENKAADFLLSKGYSILSRNYRTKQGEIDCIAKDPLGYIVFIEVKASQGNRYGNPLFWVTKQKQKKIILMAKLYLLEHKITHHKCRFDVIVIYKGKITHIKNAFTL